MEIINYFETEDKRCWRDRIAEADWEAARFLVEYLDNGNLSDYSGPDPKLFLLTDDKNLVSFCTYSEYDEVKDRSLSPWIGFVYTFRNYRGRHCMGQLINHILSLAKTEGREKIYISTGETGLYEKYGFTFLQYMISVCDDQARVYVKDL